jgi:hypothetical protein
MEHLLLLFAALEIVLLLGSEGPSKGGECALQRRYGLGGGRAERSSGRRGSMRDTHLRDEERLPGVPNPPNELAERLKVMIL